jgi:hypothetical protein
MRSERIASPGLLFSTLWLVPAPLRGLRFLKSPEP